MIAYLVQIHEGVEYLEWMLPLIWHRRCRWRGAGAHPASLRGLCERGDGPVLAGRLGGMTVVSAILSGMEQLLGRGPWSHFINISARDVPLMSQAAMMRRLSLAARDGKRNFLQYFGGVWVDWLEPEADADQAVTYERSAMFPAL